MKFTPKNIQKLKIAVYQSNGIGFSVVFLHASSIGAASFYKQMMSKEGENLRFISIDMPGHGASDFSFNPQEFYKFNKLSELMIETIESLELEKFVLVGHFLGAHIALNISQKLKNISGVILQGFSPLQDYSRIEDAYKINEVSELLFKGKLDGEQAARLAQIFVSKDAAADISFVDNIKNTDPNFRKYLAESFKTVKQNDIDLIKENKVPISIILGEKDRIVKQEKLEEIKSYLWREKVQIISDSGNSPMWENPKIFNFVIQEFINDLM
jgi:pimeloyl-ACP methyl ester carboxylesterase